MKLSWSLIHRNNIVDDAGAFDGEFVLNRRRCSIRQTFKLKFEARFNYVKLKCIVNRKLQNKWNDVAASVFAAKLTTKTQRPTPKLPRNINFPPNYEFPINCMHCLPQKLITVAVRKLIMNN